MSDLDSPLGSPAPAVDFNASAAIHEQDRDAPMANPDLDMDLSENEALSDVDSELSEVDEAEFEDFDPNTVVPDREVPIHIDEEITKTLKAGKRKRPTGDGEAAPKKKKEARREKTKKKTRGGDESDDGSLGEEMEGKRARKPKSVRVDGERKDKERVREKKQVEASAANEDDLTPEERRKRALDRVMDAAVKSNKRRRKKDEVVCLRDSKYNVVHC